MLNKPFRNNGFVVSVGNGMGSVLFPCPPAGLFLRNQGSSSGVNWSGCGNYGYSDTSSVSYAYYTDGNCGEYWTLNSSWNRPAGDILYDTGCCQVIWDGSSYYVDDNCNPCGDANTLTGQTRAVNVSEILWQGCNSSGYFSVSYELEEEYHDGTCGTYWLPAGSYQAESGDVIYSYNGCCYVYYDSYNSPYYYVEDNCTSCPDAGPTGNTRVVNEQSVYWQGCGTEGHFTYTYTVEAEYYDGMCNTYWAFESTWEAMNGDTIYDGGCCTVQYESFGGYIIHDNCGPNCPPSGEPTGNVNLNYSYTMPWSGCGSSDYFTYETETAVEYHDGACSSYWENVRWYAPEGTTIYSSGTDNCCSVVYNYPFNYSVNDNCSGSGCPTGPTGNSGSSSNTMQWDGCGTNGTYTYETYDWSEEHDGNCGTYYNYSQTWAAVVGDTIYDDGCCRVVYTGAGSYQVEDNCGSGGGGGGDYPPAGTLLNSGSGDQTAEITWGELIGQTNYQTVTVGSYWFNEFADGSGGSTWEGSTDYFADGTNLFTEPYGLEVNLNWAVDVNGTTESGSFVWGNEIGNWTLQSGTPSRTSTSLVDIITDGYMIYESDSWWNGDANVKVQVIFQSGGGYITNTITF